MFIYTLLNTDDSSNLATYQDAFLMLRSTLSANYINKKIPLKLENSHSKPCKYYKEKKYCVGHETPVYQEFKINYPIAVQSVSHDDNRQQVGELTVVWQTGQVCWLEM